ncbi:fungal-specific transcription factor domain-containing protein [Annulohypoxylon maeteangense]|uniref:fungal-specific transcription factor domain-containing protein n=1 Tax=Annulohypoxylon maeteangense TaxID=1927788 RepID=UPI002008D687|nr:fungal-specific transcription factor domain-containing protein [Annulohypoxylon maeteangense]KAI0879823.1 fungal-specific transcription factor domain-containing protein [Annulohypoxylon maeteangense]
MSSTSSASFAHANSTPAQMDSPSRSSPNDNSINSPAATSTPQDHAPTPSALSSATSIAAGAPHPTTFTPSGPISLDPSTTPSSALNPRSCVTCRRRKVRCDKFMPCGNCRKAQIQCVFPAPGRAPRRPRAKDPNAPPKQTSEREIELMKRLRKLESIVEDLSGQIEVETARHPSSGGSPEAAMDSTPQERERRRQSGFIYSENLPGGYPPADYSKLGRSQTGDSGGPGTKSPAGEVNKSFGRLVLNEKGKTRYVSSAFWSKINDEINQLRTETEQLSDEDTDGSDDGSSPGIFNPYPDQVDHHGFVLGYSSSNVDLRKLHPLPSQIPFIWQVYQENVDPLVKILHVPSTNKIIRELRSNMNDISPGMEALMFAIYYASITSMGDDEVKINFGADKGQLINKYRFATEQALAKANFLVTSELVVVQAFTLFLVLVRRYDDTRFAWTLTGLAIRISQSLGIHREGTKFDDLSPFDVDMRRRLWWAICILDLRSAEDQGTELTIAERTYDTQFPLNVNDADISPEMTEFPEEKTGPTDVTFCLIRYEICALSRKIHFATNGMAPCHGRSTEAERDNMLLECYERIEKKYLKTCGDKDVDVLHWVAAMIARLIMAKMRLIIYQPMLLHSTGQALNKDVRHRLFMASLEVVEYTKVLNLEPRCQQWRWLFQTYAQWHAVAYLLLETCRLPWTASLERAWIVLNAVFQTPDAAERARPGVWVPLRKLMTQAKRHREEEVKRLRADPEAAQQLDIDEQKQLQPDNFKHLSSSVRSSLAQDQWRKLVGVKGPEKPVFTLASVTNACPPTEVKPESKEVLQQQTSVGEPEPEMQYVDHLMSQPYLDSQDLFSVAFPSNQVYMTEGGAQPPGNSRPAPPAPTGTFETPGSSAYGAAAAPPQQNFLEDNPPPWLWSDNWANGPANNTTANTATPRTEDQDVDMDAEEGFNWQTWVDNGLAMGRVGFMGGI